MTEPTEAVPFGPAVDRWMRAVLALAALAMLGGTVAAALDPNVTMNTYALLVGMNALIVAVVIGLTYPTTYEVDAHEVRVRAGMLHRRVALAELQHVALATSVVASTTAAWTMHRVRLVDRGGRVVEVGPADRVGFVAEVLARAPQLVEDPAAASGRAWHDPGARRR